MRGPNLTPPHQECCPYVQHKLWLWAIKTQYMKQQRKSLVAIVNRVDHETTRTRFAVSKSRSQNKLAIPPRVQNPSSYMHILAIAPSRVPSTSSLFSAKTTVGLAFVAAKTNQRAVAAAGRTAYNVCAATCNECSASITGGGSLAMSPYLGRVVNV